MVRSDLTLTSAHLALTRDMVITVCRFNATRKFSEILENPIRHIRSNLFRIFVFLITRNKCSEY